MSFRELFMLLLEFTWRNKCAKKVNSLKNRNKMFPISKAYYKTIEMH